MCKILTDSESDMKIAAKQINEGGLVAFPTETVYGLGARLDDSSLAKIFAAKHRPYSDPLICHFDTAENAKKYVLLTSEESEIFDRIAANLWPGPLTIVAPATNAVPPLVMAVTGYVRIRVPGHQLCHRFLELCGEPVAAPSANLFGHISPTTVDHVKTDLDTTERLLIISGGEATIGIESTVIRLEGAKITILRPGFITVSQLSKFGTVNTIGSTNQKLASPAHQTRHYAPNLTTALAKIGNDDNAKEIPENAVLIDFNRTFVSVASKVLRYFDLSPIRSIREAVSKLYNILREAETTQEAKICIIADVSESGKDDEHDQELVLSLRDRLLRSAAHTIWTFKTTKG
jgi:L-threonylcarbamoyladenylate synthase